MLPRMDKRRLAWAMGLMGVVSLMSLQGCSDDATTGDTNEASLREHAFRPASLSDIERRHILDTLRYTAWNKSRTAVILGIERSTLDRKIRRYNLIEEHRAARRQGQGREPV